MIEETKCRQECNPHQLKDTVWTAELLLNCLKKEVDTKVTDNIHRSTTYSVMADEFTDVVLEMHLAMLCYYVNQDGSSATVVMNDVEIANGTANTITAATTKRYKRDNSTL